MTDLARDSSDVRRNVAVSAGAQGAAKVLHLLLNIVSTLVIIRYLTPSSYGNYVLVLTAAALVGLVADFGLLKLATREVARNPGIEDDVIGTVLLARLCMAALCIGLLQVVLFGLGATAQLHVAGFVASVLYIGDALMVSVVAFYVRIKQQYEAILQVVMEAFETTFVIVLVARRASLAVLFVPPTVATLLGGVAAVILVRRRFGVRFRLALGRVPYLLKEALPLGPALLISACYLKLDALMLAVLKTPREVGLYGAAYQPIEYTFLAAAVVVNLTFPLVAAAYGAADHTRFALLYRRGAETLVAGMLMVPVALSLIAVPLVDEVYGSAYRGAARPLQLLAVALVLMTLNGWQAFVLLGGGHQKATLTYNLAALVVAAVGCSIFIRIYGINGAAMAALFTAVFVLTCSTAAIRRYFGVHLELAPLARILTAAAALWTTLFIAKRLGAPWPVLILTIVVAYPAWLLVFGVVRRSSLRSWLHPVSDAREAAAVGLALAEPALAHISRFDLPVTGDDVMPGVGTGT